MLLQVRYVNRVKGSAPDPFNEGKFIDQDKVLEEAIDVRRVKAARPFHGNKHEIKEPIVVVYLYPDNPKDRAKELHVLSDYETFVKNVNVLKGRTRQEEKAT